MRKLGLEQRVLHFVNCIACGVSNAGITGGYKIPDQAAAKWNTRHANATFVCSPDLPDRLRTWVDMVRADAAHPAYTIQLLTEAADMIDLIDRECSLCKPYRTLPDRVQGLIHNGTANAEHEARQQQKGR